MKTYKLLLLVGIAICCSNCASITRGTTDALNVKSNPDQASVTVSRTDKAFTNKELSSNPHEGDKLIGTTPAAFKLQRKGEYLVTVSKSGYKPSEVRVTNRISGAGGAGMAGNVLVGGLVGVGVDAYSGATKDLTPNPVEVTLQRR